MDVFESKFPETCLKFLFFQKNYFFAISTIEWIEYKVEIKKI